MNVSILEILSDDNETDSASSGENVKIKLKGVEEEVREFEDPDVSRIVVLC